jgi:transcriptional regulator with XRE-family HTH domain
MWESTYLIHQTNQILALLLLLLYLHWTELRKARGARRWTAEEAAEQVGVDIRTYLGWERGECQPRPLNQLALRRTFSELSLLEQQAILTRAIQRRMAAQNLAIQQAMVMQIQRRINKEE